MSTKRLAALLHEARIGCVRNGVVGPPLWCQAKHGDHAASLIAAGVTLAATPAPLDVERLAVALRAWRGDYGAPLAVDLPDAADLARCYAEAVKSDKPRTFDQYVLCERATPAAYAEETP